MKKILCCFVLLSALIIGGCSKVEKSTQPVFSENLPMGIFYDGLIYWESKEPVTLEDGEKIGKVISELKYDDFPQSEFVITQAGASLEGSVLYKSEDTLYIKDNDVIRCFVYHHGKNSEEVDNAKEDQQIENDETIDGKNKIAPHFMYQNMIYNLCENYKDVYGKDEFKKVGLIKENEDQASANFSGNIAKNTELYAMEIQNRYMYVKFPNGNIEVYENEAYQFKNDK